MALAARVEQQQEAREERGVSRQRVRVTDSVVVIMCCPIRSLLVKERKPLRDGVLAGQEGQEGRERVGAPSRPCASRRRQRRGLKRVIPTNQASGAYGGWGGQEK